MHESVVTVINTTMFICPPTLLFVWPKRRLVVVQLLVKLITLIFLLCGIVSFAILFNPIKVGFECSDSTLRLPFKDNTVSGTATYVFALTVSILMVLKMLYFSFNNFCFRF